MLNLDKLSFLHAGLQQATLSINPRFNLYDVRKNTSYVNSNRRLKVHFNKTKHIGLAKEKKRNQLIKVGITARYTI